MEGLTDSQVLESIKLNGTNDITGASKKSFIKSYISTLGDPIIRILIIALVVKTIFLFKDFDWFETLGIFIAIFLASLISTLSEYGSEKAFEKLQEESSKIKVKVKRNNVITEIYSEEVVVGDLVMLESGDKIPADGIVIKGELAVDESSITGESKEVYKNSLNKDLLKGTVVVAKEGAMLVTKVGMNTFYGKISLELKEQQPDSPLKVRLRKLANQISKVGYVGSLLVFVSYLFSEIVIKNNFNYILIMDTLSNSTLIFEHLIYALTLSVTIIVMAVPEGLPMMITLVLSTNMKKMLKSNVLVRKLNGIETAGSLNILFSDKTGTITTGKLKVNNYISCDLNKYGNINDLKRKLLNIVIPSLIANNSAYLEANNIVGGNTTDRAVLEFVNIKNNYKVIEKIPFSSVNKYSQVSLNLDSKVRFLTKGAPEVILKECDFFMNEDGEVRYLKDKKRLNAYLEKMTSTGSRILALAYSDYKGLKNMVLIGFIEIKDNVRKEAKDAIKLVLDAGINVVMVTGDNKNTALAVANEVGLCNEFDICLTSDELRRMSDDSIKKILSKLKVVARAIPQDKSRLVRLSQELDLVVGMTGDGVNDAPALKKADVGFSFGSGTSVAKEASEIVILDNNFLSISKAILYGRTVFKSIRKFIIFQLTVNLCAVTLSIVGPFIGITTPVTVIQMLWINMVMDTLAAIAFAFEPALNEYMKELPKKRDEQIINKYMFHQIIFTGIYSTLLCIFFLKVPFVQSVFLKDEHILTAFFGLFIFIGIFNSFNARTHRLNLVAHLKENKFFIVVISFIMIVQIILIYFGGDIFRTYGLSFFQFNIMILFSLTVIPIDFIRKFILRKKGIVGGV